MGGVEVEVAFKKCCDTIREAYNKLKEVIGGSTESRITGAEYMKCFTDIYNLAMRDADCYVGKVYAKYRELLEDYVTSVMMPAIQNNKDIELMLRELVKQWRNYSNLGRWLQHFFHYLDRYYTCRHMLPTLQQVKIDVFRDLCYKELNGKASEAVITLIDKEREGEVIDKDLLKKVVQIFVDMGTDPEYYFYYYEKDFEEQMIDDTGSYYSRKASSWIAEDSCPDYMRKVEECLKKERERASHYLIYPSSEDRLIERVQHELLVVHHKRLIDDEHSGCHALLREEKVDDLSRMLRLFRDIHGGKLLKPMGDIFQQYITHQGEDLVQQLGVEATASDQSANKINRMQIMIFHKIIELHDEFMFLDHKVFRKARKEAFEVFCNKLVAGASTVELLATFCENLIKNNNSDNEADIEETLEKVAELLVYFHDKDLFIEFHRKKLARRLLLDQSSGNKDDNGYDKFFVTKLKRQYGGCFTSKMEGMLTDLVLAKETQTKLENWFGSNPVEKPNFDLSVKTLTTGFWPSFNSSDLKLPSEMVKGVEAFKKFYEKTTRSRKLTWVYSLGNCHVNGIFEQKTIELIVSTSQAAALLLFNDAHTLTFSEMHTQLNLNRDDLVRTLHSLSCAKYKILNKEPKTKTISETDSFEFNSKFTDRMRRIKIPLPHAEERKKITEDVNNERKHHVDAALVRIMKSRKVLGHQQLVSECVELLSKTFKPDIKVIKKRIDNLISREFLERDTDNPSIFKYLP